MESARLQRGLLALAIFGAALLSLDCGTDGRNCGNDRDCPPGQYCKFPINQCRRVVVDSATCSGDADCDGGVCDPETQRCTGGDEDGGFDGGDEEDGGDRDGGSEDGGETDGGNPDSCSSKCDCPEDMICRSSKCVAPSGGCNSSADCVRGKVCNFSKSCVTGCEPGGECDCPADKLCHPSKYVCEPCSFANPCPEGTTCVGGACKETKGCSTSSDCATAQPGTVCVDGSCSNCTSHSDCNVSPYKDAEPKKSVCAGDGLCKAAGCSDADCRNTLGEKAYCDSANNACALRECLRDEHCSASGVKCDTNLYRCVPEDGCVGDTLAQCQQACSAQSKTCDEVSCTCASGPGGGGDGSPCQADGDCDSGYMCAPMISTCAEECLPDGTGSVTGKACGQVGCMLGGFLGGKSPCLDF